jgi:acetolactate synthase-1/2/3 large subunit
MKTVSDWFVRCLEAEGVKRIFGVPGEETEDLLFSLEESSIQFIPTRHEQGAAFMANVWGRLTGRAGVCLATLGPGATNLVTGVADANLDKAPLVAITAQGGFGRRHHESHQLIDVISLFKPITKWNSSVYEPSVVAEIVRQAFKVAEAEKPGATHVELSEDIARLPAPDDAVVLPRRTVRRPAPDAKALEEAANLLSRARRPLILAGNGAIRKLASEELTRLATTFHIPVACTFMAKGAISDRLDQSLMSIGMGFQDYVFAAAQRADLIICVGYDIAEYPPEKWNPSRKEKVVHIDFEPAGVYNHYTPEVEVVGDIAAALSEIHDRLKGAGYSSEANWHKPFRDRIVQDIESYRLAENDLVFTVPGALHIIREELSDDGLIISDVGSHKLWIGRNFPTYCPNGCIIGNGLASMGISLPGGIAAALQSPGRPIVAAMGDGGALMNIQELETAKRLGVPLVIVIFNDNDYGLISWKQTMHRDRSVSTKIGNPDFAALAQSFGIRGEQPKSVGSFRMILRDALKNSEPCVIELPVNPAVNMELVNKLKSYWKRST